MFRIDQANVNRYFSSSMCVLISYVITVDMVNTQLSVLSQEEHTHPLVHLSMQA